MRKRINVAAPAWWADWPEPRFSGEEDRTLAKQQAASILLGVALNVDADHETHWRIRTWTDPLDYPGVLGSLAEAVLDTTWDGDIQGLVLRLIAAGHAGRIRNGVLVSDLYWTMAGANYEEPAFMLRAIRSQEKRLAEAMAAVSALQ